MLHSSTPPSKILIGYSDMEAGNLAWKEERYEDALLCWSKAIDITSTDNKDLLKVLYSNRSAAYSK